MNTTYGCLTLRCVHHVVTGEFATVGAVVHAPATRFLEARLNGTTDEIPLTFLNDFTHFENQNEG